VNCKNNEAKYVTPGAGLWKLASTARILLLLRGIPAAEPRESLSSEVANIDSTSLNISNDTAELLPVVYVLKANNACVNSSGESSKGFDALNELWVGM
jgi:hypothetical protein